MFLPAKQISDCVKTGFTRSYLLLFLLSFSTFSSVWSQEVIPSNEKVSKILYLTANIGNTEDREVLDAISQMASNEERADLLLLGNSTGPGGYMNSQEDSLFSQKNFRQQLLSPLQNFQGKIILIPGTNEWNSTAPESIDDMESFLQENDRIEVWPNDGCPLERESLNELVEIIHVDSQWFLEDWDQRPKMNTDCDIKTREQFFVEFKDDLKDAHGKIKIVAIHHPVLSRTKNQFFKAVTGLPSQNFANRKQKELRDRLETLASLFEDVIFVSGKGQNLQYLFNDRNPQIISGAAGATEPVKSGKEGQFTSDEKGFTRLSIFEDGLTRVEFFSVKEKDVKKRFSANIQRERPTMDELELEIAPLEDSTYSASIYTSEETNKSGLYKWLWGERYRELYSRPVKVPVLILDSLPGNLRPISEGGGQQSRSLRLINDTKNEFTLRAMRKDPIQYLQADVVTGSYIRDFAKNTIAERYISDFFTTANPYAPFAVNDLSNALDIHHANPELFYVPRQKALDIYNEDYGNALFMLEEHVGDENKEFKTFGSPDDILSTADLLMELRESPDSYVDEQAYVRARLFDMLIGDWDRHQDQWRWAQFQENSKKRYEPIPRDRDHAFPKYDGPAMLLLKSVIPQLRKMQTYDSEIKNIKRFNWSGYPLDQRFITTAEWREWEQEAQYIQENLTEEKINAAFATLPSEVQDEELEKIKAILLERKENLVEIAREYFEYFNEFQTLVGTEEDDVFQIERQENGITTVTVLTGGETIFRNSYSSEETNEIWLYGLDGEDRFEITGKAEELIKLKVLGGEEKDIYDFKNPKKAKLYDFASTESEIVNPASSSWLVDSYDINNYDYLKKKYSENRLIPVGDYVSDAGFTIGLKDIYTKYGLANNPFSEQYILGAQYFFASNGYKIFNSAEFAHVFYKWNFKLSGYYSSPNYFINYFGSGNETVYRRDDVERRFNRVKLEQWELAPSLIWRNDKGSSFGIEALVESVEVGYQPTSFVGQNFSPENDIFDSQVYAGAEVDFSYLNKSRPAFPKLGSDLNLIAGYKENIDEHDNQFAYLESSASFDYPLIPSGFAVVASKIGGEVIFGNDYEFYHAATLGGNRSLRGYRNHRFNGQSSFYHSTDLRTALGLFRTKFIPVVAGVSAGFDYGRVWAEDDSSKKWHYNYGGSVWVSAALALTANVGFYRGGDGNRLTFTLNFKY